MSIPPQNALDRIVFRGEIVTVGLFRCPTSTPNFEDTGPTTGHLLVFPRTAVVIEQEGRDRVVATPNVVMLYNRGQRYRRERLSELGDASDWFAFEPSVLREALARFEPRVAERAQGLFDRSHGPSAAREYLAQRGIVQALLAGRDPHPLAVEEACVAMLDAVLEQAHRPDPRHAPASAGASGRTRGAHRDLAANAQALLARRFREDLSLPRIAEALHVSPYHLARVFRAQSGLTLHRYAEQLRLRTALAALPETRDLARLGLELGYSSHSHFTAAFRRAFGVTPSAYRDRGVERPPFGASGRPLEGRARS